MRATYRRRICVKALPCFEVPRHDEGSSLNVGQKKNIFEIVFLLFFFHSLNLSLVGGIPKSYEWLITLFPRWMNDVL